MTGPALENDQQVAIGNSETTEMSKPYDRGFRVFLSESQWVFLEQFTLNNW